MDQLLPVINKLQDVFNAIGGNTIDLPQICVIGSQSSGKSSVLEHIVGKDFLPRGSGIVTRRPLILQLHHIKPPKDGPQEWGEFLHKQNQIFTDFNKIRDEIESATAQHCGPRGISSTPIRLSIYSPKVLNLTLVDLPGLTKVSVVGHPTDLPAQIRKLSIQFISNPHSIILCVTAGNTDLATSDGIQLAQEVDPEGHRTLGVVTKIDIMDKGTDAMDIFTGNSIPLRLGFIGVVMRSQQDIKDAKPINQALKDEEKFFQLHPAYRSIAHKLGTNYLTKTLNSLLMRHIHNSIPELKSRISKMTQICHKDLVKYGGDSLYQNKSGLLLNFINIFSNDYANAIDGKLEELSVNELYGGARINYIFSEIFSKYIEKVRLSNLINDQDIRNAIKNSTGTRSALFVPEGSFEYLVKILIKKLEDPALECAEQVYLELQRIIKQIAESKELQRFKNLKIRLVDEVNTLLQDCKSPTRAMISNLIKIELAYINTNHEDFIGGGGAVSQLFQTMAVDKQEKQIGNSLNMINPTQKTQVNHSNPNSSGFFNRFYNDQNTAQYNYQNVNQNQSNPFQSIPGGPIHLSVPTTIVVNSPMNQKEEFEIQLIKQLIRSYFDIVCKNISDTIPKTIMYFLVNTSKSDMQNKLVEKLYKEELFEDLLEENPDIVLERKRCKEMLVALNQANSVLMELRNFY